MPSRRAPSVARAALGYAGIRRVSSVFHDFDFGGLVRSVSA